MSTQNIPKVSEIFSFEVIRSQKSYEVLKMFVDIRACNLFISICHRRNPQEMLRWAASTQDGVGNLRGVFGLVNLGSRRIFFQVILRQVIEEACLFETFDLLCPDFEMQVETLCPDSLSLVPARKRLQEFQVGHGSNVECCQTVGQRIESRRKSSGESAAPRPGPHAFD